MMRALRPVGNKIYYKPEQLKQDFFSPFLSQYYQSGTAALSATLIAVRKNTPNIKHPKVLLPAYTCPDVISAALYANVEAILIDFEQNSPWMSLEAIKQQVETNPSIIAIVGINFLGIHERLQALSNLIKNKNIILIEDSAQDFPCKPNGFSEYCDFIISSFGKGKPLGLLGGGIVLTKNTELQKQLPQKCLPIIDKTITSSNRLKYRLKLQLYNIIINPFFYYIFSSLPFIKLGETIFKKLEGIKPCPSYILDLVGYNYQKYRKRKSINLFYKNMLAKLNSDKIIDLTTTCDFNANKPLLRYPILITDNVMYKKLIQRLDNANLGASIMYKTTLPNIEGITHTMFENKCDDFKNAELFASQLITLPTHDDVSISDLEKIEHIFKHN